MKDPQPESGSLLGQVAVVTGAGRGIGRSVSLSLAAAGAHLVLAARTRNQIEAVAREIGERGGEALAVAADVSQEKEVLRLFETVKERFGRLEILVNNAGTGIFGPLEGFSAEDFDRVLSTNLRGTFLCAREALKLMKARRRGTIINIASVVGFKGYPRQAAYTASKHGVMGLTKSLAAEAHEAGIRVSAVLPGGVDTDLAGQARPDLDRSQLLQPEDIARTVMFLLTLPDRAAIDEIYIRRRSSQPF
jgi:3-oxoacyl-[acyl-carrier protein] reductase